MSDDPTPLSDATSVLAQPLITQPWGDFETVVRHAERARVAGDTKRAHTFYSHLVELNPNEPRGWAGLAETATSLDEAVISWAYVLALAPSSWEANAQLDKRIQERISQSGIADAAVLVALGQTLAEVGQKPAAHRLLVRATELDPTKIEAWLWRAGVTDDPNDTINSLKQVLATAPENAQAQAGLKWALSKQEQASTQVPVGDAQSAAQSFQAGQQALHDNNLALANEHFLRATQLDPVNESAWFWRGSTAPNTDEALTCMTRALAINPQNQAAKESLWWLRVKKYRESFAIRTAPLPPLGESLTDQPSVTRAPQRRTLRNILFVVLFIVFILVSLGVVVLWRLA